MVLPISVKSAFFNIRPAVYATPKTCVLFQGNQQMPGIPFLSEVITTSSLGATATQS